MPIYEYRCTGCGEELEIIQKISEPPLIRCKKCDGKLERLMSNNAFHLKGSGWYKTDYAKPNKEEKADSKKETNSKDTDKVKKENKANKTIEKSAP